MTAIGLGSIYAGLANPAAALANQLTTGGVVNPAMAGASRIASGADVGKNPYLDALYNQASGRITQNFRDIGAPSMALDASAAGRTGGGLYALLRNQGEKQVGNTLSDLATSLYGGAYNTDRANQLQALGLQGQLGEQATQNRLAGANLFNQGTQQAMQGIQLGSNLQNQQFQNLGQLLNVGNQLQQAPWGPGLQYANVLGATPGIGGGSTQTSPYYTNTGANVLGGALGGSQVGSALGQLIFGQSGAAGGAGYGALAGGLFGLSDVRAKEDIRRVGETDAGVPVYTYRYRGAPGIHMGVMAQELAQTQPEAVGVRDDGLLAVDYGQVR